MALDAERNLDMTFKMSNLFFNGTTSFMNVINALMEYASSTDPAVKTLRKYMDAGGHLDFTVCKPEYEKELSERFRDEGITYMQTRSMANGGVDVFLYAESDRAKVKEILNDLRGEYGKSGITDHATMYAYAKGNVREIPNLNRDEAILFAEHAEKRNIKILVEEPAKDQFRVSFAEKDSNTVNRIKADVAIELILFAEHAEKRNIKILVEEPAKDQFRVSFAEKDSNTVNRIKADVAIELSGLAGQALRKQLHYENDKLVKILDMAKNYESKEPSFLIDLRGNEMKVEYSGVTYKGESGVITVENNEPDFEERVDELIMQMNGPVLLNEQEKNEFDEQLDKKAYLVDAERRNGRPEYTADEYAAIKEMMAKRELYEMKLALLEPEQAVYDICLENDDMRLATFEEYNDINKAAVLEKAEIESELIEEIQDRFCGYRDKTNLLDYEMVDFEEAVLDGREYDAFEKDVFDLIHDKNNNLIPDEYEPEFKE